MTELRSTRHDGLREADTPIGYTPEEPGTSGTAPAPPPIDRSQPTHTYDAMRRLLDPDRGLQWAFTPGFVDPDRAAVVRGRLIDAAGNPLSGVDVAVMGHTEFGRTRSRIATGMTSLSGYFELLINGGGPLVFEFTSASYIAAQRAVDVPWNGWLTIPDVVLTPTTAMAGGPPNGSRIVVGPTYATSDGRGANRSMRFYVPSSTSVSGVGTPPTTAFDIRMAEVTRRPAAGIDPVAAMPAELPGTTSYTYAAEAQVVVMGTAVNRPVFDRDVFLYVRSDGFLTGTGFAGGSGIPYGSYDAARGAWSAENNGTFVIIGTGTTAGCITGTTIPTVESGHICGDKTNFPAGTWMRVPIRHFSLIDLNRLLGIAPPPTPQTQGANNDSACNARTGGSIIYCDAQILGESWPISGTPYSLMYLSDRHEGRREDYSVRVVPVPTAMPAGTPTAPNPTSVRMELIVAGERAATLPSTAISGTGQVFALTWDGSDSYGRELVGPQRATVRIGYEYSASYLDTAPTGAAEFAGFPEGTTAQLGDGDTVIVWIEQETVIGNVDDLDSGLAGLGIDARHFYDPATGTLILGTGQRRTAESVTGLVDPAFPPNVSTPPYNGSSDFGASATSAGIGALTVGPDGTVYWWDGNDGGGTGWRLRRRRRGDTSASDLGTNSYNQVTGMSVGRRLNPTSGLSEDVLWVVDRGGVIGGGPASSKHLLYAVSLNEATLGARTIVLGAGEMAGAGAVSAGSPANPATADAFLLSSPAAVVAAPDGSVLVADEDNGRILRVRERFSLTGTIERQVELVLSGVLFNPEPSLALGPDGSIYFTTIDTIRPDSAPPSGAAFGVDVLRPDGRRVNAAGGAANTLTNLADGTALTCAAGSTTCAYVGAGVTSLAIGPDGGLCFGAPGAGSVSNRVRCARASDGLVFTLAGARWVDSGGGASFMDTNQTYGTGSRGSPATRTLIGLMGDIAWSPDGRLFFVDQLLIMGGAGARVRFVAPTLDGSLLNTHVIASSDGSMFYEFNAAGRHVRTVDAITGTNLVRFEYDATVGPTLGRLEGIYDAEDALIDVAWETASNRIRIVAPGSVTTTLSLASPTGYVNRVCSALVASASCTGTHVSSASAPSWGLTYGLASFAGLLTTLTDARGGSHVFGYDSTGAAPSGRLLSDSDVGAVTTVGPVTTTSDGFRRVTISRPADPGLTADARATSYDTRFSDSGVLERRFSRGSTTTFATTTMSVPADGRSVTTSSWTGAGSTSHTRPDPRPTFGADAPFAARTTLTRPSGALSTTTITRNRTWTDAAPLGTWNAADSLTSTVTVSPLPPGAGGTGTWTRTIGPFVSGGREITLTPPSGNASRATTIRIDSRGRVTRYTAPGMHPVCVTYSGTAARPTNFIMVPASGTGCDAASTTRREVNLGYTANRYLNTVTAGWSTSILSTTFTMDARGVPELIDLPPSTTTNAIDPAWDAHQNLISFTSPGGSAHTFAWTPRDELLSYTPPAAAFSGAEIVSSIYRGGGSLDLRTYRGAGRSASTTLDNANGYVDLVTLSAPGAANTIDVTARDAGGRPTSITATGGVLGLVYDGSVVTDEVYSLNGSSGVAGRYRRSIPGSAVLTGERVCFIAGAPSTDCPATGTLGGRGRSILRTYHDDGFLTSAYDDPDGDPMTTTNRFGSMGYSVPVFTAGAGMTRSETATAGASTVVTSMSVSPLGELTSRLAARSGADVYGVEICQRDELGRVRFSGERVRSNATGTPAYQYRWYQYEYDSHGYMNLWRLWQGTWTGSSARCPVGGPTGTPTTSLTWTFNDRGNITTAGWTFGVGEDQLTSAGRTYNEVGQLLTRADVGGTRGFVHDLSGHLRSTSFPTTATTTMNFDYDAAGRLIAQRPTSPTSGKPTQHYIYRDGLNPVGWRRSTINTGTCGASGWDEAYFIYGTNRHTPDMMVYDLCADGVLSTADVYSIHYDERGSVRLVVQVTTGNVVLRIDYGPFGFMSIPINTLPVPFGFAGGIWLTDASLWHFGARDMDPLVGRWTTKDPILHDGGYNLYMYAGNDPVNFTDPTGLYFRRCIGPVSEGATPVHLTFPIHFEGGSAHDRGAIIDQINSIWSGRFGHYNVRMRAFDVDGTSYDGPSNRIRFFPGSVLSPGITGYTHGDGRTIDLPIDAEYPTAPHEAGHAMGLEHFNDDGNIMHPNDYGTGVTEGQIIRLLDLDNPASDRSDCGC